MNKRDASTEPNQWGSPVCAFDFRLCETMTRHHKLDAAAVDHTKVTDRLNHKPTKTASEVAEHISRSKSQCTAELIHTIWRELAVRARSWATHLLQRQVLNGARAEAITDSTLNVTEAQLVV
jgi:hypothetical protein